MNPHRRLNFLPVLPVALVATFFACGCGRDGRRGATALPMTSRPTTGPIARPGPATSRPSERGTPMSVRDFDAMAERLKVTRIELADGATYVPAYVDADAHVIYLWQGVRMRWKEVP